jgi:hypothetical protein
VDKYLRGDVSTAGDKITTSTITLNDVFDRCDYTYVDYLSMDTEGSEMEILSTFRFDLYKVGAFTIESVWHGDQDVMRKFMDDNGYTFIKFDGMDDYYINKEGIKQ